MGILMVVILNIYFYKFNLELHKKSPHLSHLLKQIPRFFYQNELYSLSTDISS